MKLDQQPELLADAVRATSEYYHIAPVYIEKDYWISKILQQLSRSIYANNTVFKGGTSLSKGYGLIKRFSEDVDVAVLTGELSGNQIKTLITKVCNRGYKNKMFRNLQVKVHDIERHYINIPHQYMILCIVLWQIVSLWKLILLQTLILM